MPSSGRPTTLLELRDFLRSAGGAPPPWSPPGQAVDALYDLLHDRQDDEGFWAELRDLAGRLEDRRFDPTVLKDAEILSDATVGRLIDDLRRSVSHEQATSWRRWLGCSVSATALAGFLLLGTATGCKDDGSGDADVDADADADQALCEGAVSLGLDGTDGGVYCELVGIIEGTELTSSQQSALVSCLAELSASRRATLLEQFQTMSDDQLAQYLDGMSDYGGDCYEDAH